MKANKGAFGRDKGGFSMFVATKERDKREAVRKAFESEVNKILDIIDLGGKVTVSSKTTDVKVMAAVYYAVRDRHASGENILWVAFRDSLKHMTSLRVWTCALS